MSVKLFTKIPTQTFTKDNSATNSLKVHEFAKGSRILFSLIHSDQVIKFYCNRMRP